MKEAAKFVRDFKSLAKEADESLVKHKALELDIERLLREVVSQDIMSVVQINFVVDTSNLQTKLERTKERFKNCIIKKENEYAKLWNDWYKKCEECKYDKISYDKAYNDMQQKIERLQAQLGDLKSKRKDTPCNKLHDTIYENAKLRAQLFDKVSKQKDTTRGTSANTEFIKQSIFRKPPSSSRPKLYVVTPLPKSTAFPKVGETNALSNQVTLNSVPSSQETNVVKNDNVLSSGIFRMNPFKASRKQKANVSNIANQMKHKAQVWKPKNVGSKERLASPNPSTPRSCLRWSPTGRIFDLKGKLIATSESVCQSDCSKGGQNWFDTLLILLLSEYKPKDKEDHGDNECDTL
ncbi:hypothetical protein Tco_0929051 [Tanacetum coccineum]